MRHRRLIALLAITTTTAFAACGSDDSTSDSTPATAPAATTATTVHDGTHPDPGTAPAPTTAVDDGVLTIVLSDFAFGGLPESVPAGTKLAVENISHAELHEIVAFRINDGETRTAEQLLALEEAELFQAVEPVPATVLLAPPGAPQIQALGDGTLSEPGRYLLFCGIPTGADPEEYLAAAAAAGDGPPDVAGGPPHFVHGMFADLIVE
jgi:hypothetical protein